MYIFFGKRAGNAGGGASVSLGMIVGACAILPFGVASAGTSMFSMSVLPLALLLGVFSSALPYGCLLYTSSRTAQLTPRGSRFAITEEKKLPTG